MHFLSPETILAAGYLALAFIVFAESGLLFGFFFPGDTLLLLAGVLAAQGQLDIAVTIGVIMVSAIAGGQAGYVIGRHAGPRLFKKKDGILFRHEYIEQSEAFYEKHGGKTIVLARFVPIVRTFAPVVAGIGKMDQARFTLYNVLGSGIWGAGVTLLGYFVGSRIPNLDHYIMPVVAFVMVTSFGPAFYHVFKDPRSRALLKEKFTRKK